MNDGVFRDQQTLCGWCNELVDSDEKHAVKGEKTFIHKTCWQKIYDKAVSDNQAYRRKRIKEKKMKCEECGGWVHRMKELLSSFFIRLGIVTGICILVAAPSYALWRTINSDATVTHCYVEERGSGYTDFRLYGYREWRLDKEFGVYSNIQTALDAASILRCPIHPPVERP